MADINQIISYFSLQSHSTTFISVIHWLLYFSSSYDISYILDLASPSRFHVGFQIVSGLRDNSNKKPNYESIRETDQQTILCRKLVLD